MRPLSEKTKRALLEFMRAVLAAIVALVTALTASSCGSTTRAVITNRADSTQTTVSITTNNPTSWTVSPDTDVNFPKSSSSK